ncbi:hypothetical protein BDK51DRAFT_44035 [Blyttiomyces helicus]|uniref:Uncharacterized protein n=1 Tax=Blyttiomyces helicus TaxID=388810 RepID=A0A4P9WPU7_9FUNG|nr:hypothetical protein BDK51DRAFT_44035 [Blyttiomyces helicus]|eukprot:RKO94163.1 hypothetical protein BDK51DRAFT_44035 [Blyttiomyces helicus]
MLRSPGLSVEDRTIETAGKSAPAAGARAKGQPLASTSLESAATSASANGATAAARGKGKSQPCVLVLSDTIAKSTSAEACAAAANGKAGAKFASAGATSAEGNGKGHPSPSGSQGSQGTAENSSAAASHKGDGNPSMSTLGETAPRSAPLLLTIARESAADFNAILEVSDSAPLSRRRQHCPDPKGQPNVTSSACYAVDYLAHRQQALWFNI